MIKINIDKAKEIQKSRMRFVRKPLLEKLDVDFTRALEMGESTEEIIEKKQILRDVTNIVEEAIISGSTAEEITAEIKNLWDENILGPQN